MSYVSRAKEIIRNINRVGSALPSNPDLLETALAAIYNPAARSIWTDVLERASVELGEEVVINPANPEVLEDIGTLVAEVFTPLTTVQKNDAYATHFIRTRRQNIRNERRRYRQLFALTTGGIDLQDENDAIRTQADADSIPVIGDDNDDPPS